MADRWVVVQRSGNRDDDVYVYGPLEEQHASRFAHFITTEVDPATAHRVMNPIGEFLSWYGNRSVNAAATARRPTLWPPSPGSVWQDRNGDRWICCRTTSTTPYLVCLAHTGDDSAEEIWRLFGPMTFVHEHIAPNVEEPPF